MSFIHYPLIFTSVLLFLNVKLLNGCSSPNSFVNPIPTQHYQIRNVNIIDVINKKIKRNQRVEVENGVIVSIEAESKVQNKAMATSIDGSGQFLIPGLWDNHSTLTVLAPEFELPLYIANGVTSIRSNLSCPNESETSLYACHQDKALWQQKITKNQILGPNIQG